MRRILPLVLILNLVVLVIPVAAQSRSTETWNDIAQQYETRCSGWVPAPPQAPPLDTLDRLYEQATGQPAPQRRELQQQYCTTRYNAILRQWERVCN